MFIVISWVVVLTPSSAFAVIEYEFLASKLGAVSKVRTPDSEILNELASVPLTE